MKKFFLTFLILFSISLKSMEKETINETSRENQDLFALLPVELKEYIFNFLRETNHSVLETLVNILNNKDLCSLKLVNSECYNIIKNRAQKLIDQLRVYNKDIFINILNHTAKPYTKITSQDIKILKMSLYINTDIIEDDKLKLLNVTLYNHLGSTEIVEVVLKYIKKFDHDTQVKFLNERDSEGNTSLIVAVAMNYQKTVELILKHISQFDVDNQLKIINIRSKEDTTALQLAISNPEILKLFLNHIKPFPQEIQVEVLNYRGTYTHTPLMSAVVSDNKSVELILDHISNFDPNMQIAIIEVKLEWSGATPMDYCSKVNPAVYRLLRNTKYKLYLRIGYQKTCILS